jgi:hypothetical protein
MSAIGDQGEMDEVPGWVRVEVGIPGLVVTDVHVVPLGDGRAHVASPDCHCRPYVPGRGIGERGLPWSHNALDGREAYEGIWPDLLRH